MQQGRGVLSGSACLTLLKDCTRNRNLLQARLVLDHVIRHAICYTSSLLGDYTIVTLAHCGALEDAISFTHHLPAITVFSSTAIISEYVNIQHEHDAFNVFQSILQQGIQPSNYTLVAIIKACCNIHDLERGKRFHALALESGHSSDRFVSNSLISLYGKCDAISDAEDVFSSISSWNTVSWNAIISAYAENGFSDLVLQLYEKMLLEGFSPDEMTYVTAIRACSDLSLKEIPGLNGVKVSSLQLGHTLHSDCCKKGLTVDLILSTSLVNIYCKCRSTSEAEYVFSGMTYHDTLSWNAMISGYVEQGQGCKAIELYTMMQEEGFRPDQMTFVLVLQACGMLADTDAIKLGELSGNMTGLEIGQWIHGDACKKAFATDLVVFNTLMNMYARYDAITELESMFHAIAEHTIVSWNVMLSACVNQGQGEKVLKLYMNLQEHGFAPDHRTIMICLQACSIFLEEEENSIPQVSHKSTLTLSLVQMLHIDACKQSLFSDIFLVNTLLSMYGKCGSIEDAEYVFCEVIQHDLASWNSLLSVYVHAREGKKALFSYLEMQTEKVVPDVLTYVSLLQACTAVAEEGTIVQGQPSSMVALEMGRALHASAYKRKFASDVSLCNALVNMYMNCGAISEAENVFFNLCPCNVLPWNVMLKAYAEHGEYNKVLLLYNQMQHQTVDPDEITILHVLLACASLAEEGAVISNGETTKFWILQIGQALHASICNKGFTNDVYLISALISMYSNCRAIVDSENIFQSVYQYDLTCWNAMISAYVKHQAEDEAFSLYIQMLTKFRFLDHVTLVHILQACSATASLENCYCIHFNIVCAGHEHLTSLTSVVIHTYGSCSSAGDGHAIFNTLSVPHILSWNACIEAYAQEANHPACMHIFEELLLAGLNPSDITFISMLSACNHSGLVNQALQYLITMGRDYDLGLDLKHFGNLLDLLGRAGDFKRSANLLLKLPKQGNYSALQSSLLGACSIHDNFAFAEFVIDYMQGI